jgi:hypothetical protein
MTATTAALFCPHCGAELRSPGEACPSCPEIDERRRAIMRRYASQIAELRGVDADENAKALRDTAGAARALVPPVAARTGALRKTVTDAITAEAEAAEKARGAERYLRKTRRNEQVARRDGASPQVLTEAMMRARLAAEVAAEVATTATTATMARQQAEQDLTAHLDRLAALEDGAVAAERAAEHPPASVPPSVWTCLLGHPLLLLAEPDLGDDGRELVRAQLATLAKLSGIAQEFRAEGRAALAAEQADPSRRPVYLEKLGNGQIGVIPNVAHPGTPSVATPPASGAGQGFSPPLAPGFPA